VEILGIKKGTIGEIVMREVRKSCNYRKHTSLSTDSNYSDL